mgnify:FL=1
MKKKVILVIGIIVAIAVITVISLYVANEDVRDWMDEYIFRKNIVDENLPTISIENENASIYAYDNHIVILKDNKLTIYNASGKEETTINVQVNNPIFDSSGKYLLLADKGSQNVYLIYNTSLQWQKTMEGNVSYITVNKNGAVGVVLTGTTYKSVIVMYSITGNEEFKTYLSSTVATSLAISNNNDYLSFAEANTSGTVISSVVKTISVEKAKNTPTEAIIYTYNQENNSLIISIEYNNDNLICQYDNSVYRLKDGNSEKILDVDNNTLFLDIKMADYISKIQENQSGILRSEYEVKIINEKNSSENTYLLEQMPSGLYCSDNILAVDMGNEIIFLNHSAWLLKHFTSRQNYKKIILGDSVAAIVYRDRVEIISL